MPEHESNDATTTTVHNFAEAYGLTEAQANEILDLADGNVEKASRFLEKRRQKEPEGTKLREPLSAEFT
jgi:hypothetical protein